MTDKIITTLGNFTTDSEYFRDGNDLEKIIELINEQERPIKVYESAGFNDILVIDKKGNKIQFLMNVMTAADKKAISENIDNFVEHLGDKDGKYLYDLKNGWGVYDYQEKAIGEKTRWKFYSKETSGNHLAIDSSHTFPIKLYNSTNKTSLYWGIYLVNAKFSNPLGNLADEYGSEIALKFMNKIYNLEPYTAFYTNRLKILDGIQIWEKDGNNLNKKYLSIFDKLYKEGSKEPEEEIIDSKKVGEKNEDGIFFNLSENDEIFLSDVLSFGLLPDFFPVNLDVVTDPRIIGAFMEKGKLVLVTSVELDKRAKENTLAFMDKIKDDVVFKRSSEITSMISMSEAFNWKNHLKNVGINNVH